MVWRSNPTPNSSLRNILLKNLRQLEGRKDSRPLTVRDPVAHESSLAGAVVRADRVDADSILVAVVHVEIALVHVLALLVRPGMNVSRGFVPIDRT